ncbi:hypothetical protein C4J87_3307 [Pseudomonas sp. R1-43-08]|nr:hypothetical protein C4J87_3307 [Pseudomonas sp. R1-43-08]
MIAGALQINRLGGAHSISRPLKTNVGGGLPPMAVVQCQMY